MNLLRRMQSLLAGLYDAPVEHDVDDFLVCDRRRFAQVVGARAHCKDDEQVFVIEDPHGVQLGVYIDERVLARLERRDPTEFLDDDNLADFCTALEGVSFIYSGDGTDTITVNLSQGIADRFFNVLDPVLEDEGTLDGAIEGVTDDSGRLQDEVDRIDTHSAVVFLRCARAACLAASVEGYLDQCLGDWIPFPVACLLGVEGSCRET